jgi:hypothetical protein
LKYRAGLPNPDLGYLVFPGRVIWKDRAMAVIKLTKRTVEALKAPDPSGKQTLYWAEDKDRAGLGVLVSGTTAAKSWVAQA